VIDTNWHQIWNQHLEISLNQLKKLKQLNVCIPVQSFCALRGVSLSKIVLFT